LKRGWAVPAKAALDLCKMAEKRMFVVFPLICVFSYQSVVFNRWGSMTPLRQFKGVPADVVRKAEGKQFVSHASWFLLVFLFI